MRKERRRTATAQVVLTAMVIILGMIAVASVTVLLSNSQQLEFAGIAASSSIVSETPLPPANQTTTAQQGASSPETVLVSMLPGSGDNIEFSFSPDQVTVVIGVNNTVTWVNDDNAPHTVTADDGSFGSGNVGAGGGYTHTFTTPGTYRYYCAYHSWMIGTIVVKAG